MDEIAKAEARVQNARVALQYAEVWLARTKARMAGTDQDFRTVQLKRRFNISDRYKAMLLQLMTDTSLKQVDIAAELVTTQANVSNWLNGKYAIPDEFHLAIEDFVKAEKEKLLPPEQQEPVTVDTQEFLARLKNETK